VYFAQMTVHHIPRIVRQQAMAKKSATVSKLVFLFDVDNTLLDNDRVTDDLQQHFERDVGRARAKRYWSIFEELREQLGYADYLGALQRYRA